MPNCNTSAHQGPHLLVAATNCSSDKSSMFQPQRDDADWRQYTSDEIARMIDDLRRLEEEKLRLMAIIGEQKIMLQRFQAKEPNTSMCANLRELGDDNERKVMETDMRNLREDIKRQEREWKMREKEMRRTHKVEVSELVNQNKHLQLALDTERRAITAQRESAQKSAELDLLKLKSQEREWKMKQKEMRRTHKAEMSELVNEIKQLKLDLDTERRARDQRLESAQKSAVLEYKKLLKSQEREWKMREKEMRKLHKAEMSELVNEIKHLKLALASEQQAREAHRESAQRVQKAESARKVTKSEDAKGTAEAEANTRTFSDTERITTRMRKLLYRN